ncbi:MAG: hypothetical protein PHS48_09660 [Bacteroidales bacterium]|nr:hypothetical protein [Bacteroidales bacterium]
MKNFTTLPDGKYHSNVFNGLGGYGLWWASTQYGSDVSWYRHLAPNYNQGLWFFSALRNGLIDRNNKRNTAIIKY